jgi:histidine triad (HIT) family protein
MPEAPGNRSHASSTCAFCRIISGEEEASVVCEDNLSRAFLHRRPLFPGHCLLVRKRPLRDAARPSRLPGRPLFQNAQLSERAIEEGLGADGTFVALNNVVRETRPPPAYPFRASPPQGWP